MARRHPPHTRARDLDRARTCARLDIAYADGQLTADEHREFVARARSAKTLRELAGLVADLQPVAEPEAAPRPPGARRTRIAAGVVTLTAVALLVWLVLPGRSDPAAPDTGDAAPSSPTTAASAATQLDPIVLEPVRPLEPGGFAQVVEAYRATFGDTVVHRLILRPDRADAERALPDAPDRIVDYSFRGGFQRSGTTTSPRLPGHRDLDLTEVDAAALDGVVGRAPDLVGRPGNAVTHALIGDDGTYTINVYVADGGYVRAAPDGTILRVFT